MSYYVLNTNMKEDKRFTLEMIREKKAAAYSKGWREKIGKLQKDDIVFLFQNRVGIIAYGIADGEVKENEENDESYMSLSSFKKLKYPMNAKKMRNLSDRWPGFPHMLYSIDAKVGERFIKEIEENHLSDKHN